jgi:hypothetical protein
MRQSIARLTGLMCATLWLVQIGAAAETSTTKVTVLARENTLAIDRAVLQGNDLLVPANDVPAITGFELKPQGLCAGDVCITISPDSNWVTDQGGEKYFNVTRFAAKMDQAFAANAEENVWSFTPVPRPEASPLLSGYAPDFALIDGPPVGFSRQESSHLDLGLVVWLSL